MKVKIFIIFFICLFSAIGNKNILLGYEYKKFPILSEKRSNLTKDYVKKHYGLEDIRIVGPYMIVVHYTASSTIKETLQIFKADELQSSRKDIIKGGLLNVGVHYVIDTNGDTWSLLPADIIGRHTIGFNHVSVGIELVAENADKITRLQLESCTKLVAELSKENNKIKYLIGHYEYMQRNLPHFSLFRELDESYKFTKKSDPGKIFMGLLRSELKKNFNIELLP